MKMKNKLPPDGGYGWVIAAAMAINSFIYIPMMHCFGLIFKETFTEMGLSGSQVSLIVNLHAAFGMLTGLLNGLLVKSFGYRKVAFLSAIMYFVGVTITSFAQNFQHFIFSFGILASLGIGMSRSSYSLAINTYFKKNRSKAMSFTVTFVGLGQILIPQLVNFLMKFYTSRGVMLIMGGISSHFFATAMLLHPVKWYMKEEEIELVQKNEEPPSPRNLKDQQYADSQIWDSHLSLNDTPRTQTPEKKQCLSKLSSTFDLDLLKDPIFINILIGMAFAVFSELNFTVLTPFILNDYGMTNDQIANFMSTSALADVALRLVAPYIGETLKKTPRDIFLGTLLVLIIMRCGLLLTNNFYFLLIPAVGLGMAKGVRRVYVGLIIPSHVSLNKLPSASGMEMMANGVCILGGGAVLGFVRDFTDSYSGCIIIMNIVTSLTILLWTLEKVVLRFRRKKKETVAVEN